MTNGRENDLHYSRILRLCNGLHHSHLLRQTMVRRDLWESYKGLTICTGRPHPYTQTRRKVQSPSFHGTTLQGSNGPRLLQKESVRKGQRIYGFIVENSELDRKRQRETVETNIQSPSLKTKSGGLFVKYPFRTFC